MLRQFRQVDVFTEAPYGAIRWPSCSARTG